MKKNIAIGVKPKKKSIPININSNPAPGKFLISNQVNQIASSYLSMGQKIQISKNLKNSKVIHVNTNSAKNYYTLNSKEAKPTNGIITNSLINNYKVNNISDNNGINFNNYNKNNNYSQHSQQLNEENNSNSIGKNLIRYKNLNINPKHGKNISSITNSLLSNDLLINGYQTSKNNNNNSNCVNNSKPKNKIVSTNSKGNVSKIRQTYSTRPNFLDSKNKTKKVPMKSKIRQYKYQYKNGKAVSTSFSKVHVTKNNYQDINPSNIYNYEKGDNNITNENNRENIFVKKTNDNFMINNNIYEIKNKHFRHNTASFDNKDIINIFNNQNFSDKNINSTNINYINNIGLRANRCINNADSKIRYSNLNQNRSLNNKNDNINNSNIYNEYSSSKIINNPNNLKKVPNINNQYTKGRIGDIKVYINEKKINQKEKYNQNINNVNAYTNNNNNNIYNKYHTNNISREHINNNNNIFHIKNAHSINNNISGIRKISVKQKEIRKSNNNIINNQNKIIHKRIPVQKNKGNNLIPSQRNNIKINLSKFLQDVKIKQNNKLVGRKSLSIKRLSKENNSDFSLSQLNDKFAQKILKNNDEGNDLDNYILNHRQNINKTIQEEIKENIINNNNKNKSQEQNNDNNNINIENNILIDTNYISNMQNKAEVNRISSMPTNVIKELSKKNNNENNNNKYNVNNNNYKKVNYNSNASTNNNNYLGNNKNDYSIDNNITDLTNGNCNNNNINNKAYLKNKENINNLNINNNTNDMINSNSNSNNKKILNKNIKNEKTTNNKNQYNITYENNINITKNNNNDIINNKKIIDNNIYNNLFDEDNLNDLPEDYDDKFNDLYSIINKMNFGNVLICVEGYFTPEGRCYKKYKEKFDKFYDKLYSKKGNSFANSNNKPKKIMEGMSLTSNTKTCSSSSKKNINAMYNDLNIVKDLNIY